MNLEPEAALLKNAKYVKFAQEVREKLAEIDKSLTSTRSDSNAQLVSSRLRSLQSCLEDHREHLDVPEKAAILRSLQSCLVDCQSAGVHKQATQTLEYMIKLMGPNLGKSLPIFLVSLLCRLPQAASETVAAMRDLLKNVIQKTNGNLLKPCTEGIIAGLLPALEQTATGDDKESMKLLDALLIKLSNDCQHLSSGTINSNNTNSNSPAAASSSANNSSGAFAPSPFEGVRVFFRCLWYLVANDPNLRSNALILLSNRLFKPEMIPSLANQEEANQIPEALRNNNNNNNNNNNAKEGEDAAATRAAIRNAYLGGDPKLCVRALCIAATDSRENTQARLLELLQRHLPLNSDILTRDQKIEILSRVLFIATTNRNAMLMRLIRWVYGGNSEIDEAVAFFKETAKDLVCEALCMMVRRCITQRESDVSKLVGKETTFSTVLPSTTMLLTLQAKEEKQIYHSSTGKKQLGGNHAPTSTSAGAQGDASKTRSAPHVFQVIVALLQREESSQTFQTLLPVLGPMISDWVTSNIIDAENHALTLIRRQQRISVTNGQASTAKFSIGGPSSASHSASSAPCSLGRRKLPSLLPSAVTNFVINATAQVLDVVPIELFLDGLVGEVRRVSLTALEGQDNLDLYNVADTAIRKMVLGIEIVCVFYNVDLTSAGTSSGNINQQNQAASNQTSSSATVNKFSVKALVNCARQLGMAAAALFAFFDLQGRGYTALPFIEKVFDLCQTLCFRIAPSVPKHHHRIAIVSGVMQEVTQLFQLFMGIINYQTRHSVEQAHIIINATNLNNESFGSALAGEFPKFNDDYDRVYTFAINHINDTSSCFSENDGNNNAYKSSNEATDSPLASRSHFNDTWMETQKKNIELATAQITIIALATQTMPALRGLANNTSESGVLLPRNVSSITDSAASLAEYGREESSFPADPPSPNNNNNNHHSPASVTDQLEASLLNRIVWTLEQSFKTLKQSHELFDQSSPFEASLDSTQNGLGDMAIQNRRTVITQTVQKHSLLNSNSNQLNIQHHNDIDALCLECSVALSKFWLTTLDSVAYFDAAYHHQHNVDGNNNIISSSQKGPLSLKMIAALDTTCDTVLKSLWAVFHPKSQSLHCEATDVFLPLAKIRNVTALRLVNQPLDADHARRCTMVLGEVSKQKIASGGSFFLFPTWVQEALFLVCSTTEEPMEACSVEERAARFVCENWIRTLITRSPLFVIRPLLMGTLNAISAEEASPVYLPSSRFPNFVRQLRGLALASQNELIRNALGYELPLVKVDEQCRTNRNARNVIGEFLIQSATSTNALATITKVIGIALAHACLFEPSEQQNSSSSSFNNNNNNNNSSSSDFRSLTTALKSALSTAVQTGQANLPSSNTMSPVILDAIRLIIDMVKGTVRWSPAAQIQSAIPIVATLVHMLLWVLRQALERSWVDMIPSVVATATLGLDFLHRNANVVVTVQQEQARQQQAAAAAENNNNNLLGDNNNNNNNNISFAAQQQQQQQLTATTPKEHQQVPPVTPKQVPTEAPAIASLFSPTLMMSTTTTTTTAQSSGILWKLCAVCIESACALFYGAVVYEMIGIYSGLGVVQTAGEFVLNTLRWSGPLLAAAADAFAEVNEMIICLSMNAALNATTAYSIRVASENLQGVISASLKLNEIFIKKVNEISDQQRQERTMSVFASGFSALVPSFGAVNTDNSTSNKQALGGGGGGGGAAGNSNNNNKQSSQNDDVAALSSVIALVPRQALTEAISKLKSKVSSTIDIAIAVENFLAISNKFPSRARHVEGVHSSIVSLSELCLQLNQNSVVERISHSLLPSHDPKPLEVFLLAMNPSEAPRDLFNPLKLLFSGAAALMPGEFVKLITDQVMRRKSKMTSLQSGVGENGVGDDRTSASIHSEADADLFAAYTVVMYMHELFVNLVDDSNNNNNNNNNNNTSSRISPVFTSQNALMELRASILTFISMLVNNSSGISGLVGGTSAAPATGAASNTLGTMSGNLPELATTSNSNFSPYLLPLLIKLLDLTLTRCQVASTSVEQRTTNLVEDAFAVLTFSKEGIRLPDLYSKMLTLCLGNIPSPFSSATPKILQPSMNILVECATQAAIRIFFSKDTTERLGKFILALMKDNLGSALDAAQSADIRVQMWWCSSIAKALIIAGGICKLNESQTLAIRASVTELLLKEHFFHLGRDALALMQEIIAEVSTCPTTFNNFVLRCGERPRFRLTSAQHAQECEARARGLKRLGYFLYASRLGTRELYTRLPQVRELIADTIRITLKREEDCPAQTNEALRMCFMVFRVLLFKVPADHTKLLQGIWTLLFPEALRCVHSFVAKYGLKNTSTSAKQQQQQQAGADAAAQHAERMLVTEIIKFLDYANLLTPSDMSSVRWMFVDAAGGRTPNGFTPVCNIPRKYDPKITLSGRIGGNAPPVRPRNAIRLFNDYNNVVSATTAFMMKQSSATQRAYHSNEFDVILQGGCSLSSSSLSSRHLNNHHHHHQLVGGSAPFIMEFDGSDVTPLRPLFALPPHQTPTNNEGLLNMIASFASFIATHPTSSGGGSSDTYNTAEPEYYVADSHSVSQQQVFADASEDEVRKLFEAGFTKREDGVDLLYVDWLLGTDFMDAHWGDVLTNNNLLVSAPTTQTIPISNVKESTNGYGNNSLVTNNNNINGLRSSSDSNANNNNINNNNDGAGLNSNANASAGGTQPHSPVSINSPEVDNYEQQQHYHQQQQENGHQHHVDPQEEEEQQKHDEETEVHQLQQEIDQQQQQQQQQQDQDDSSVPRQELQKLEQEQEQHQEEEQKKQEDDDHFDLPAVVASQQVTSEEENNNNNNQQQQQASGVSNDDI